jgi:hypothetical protein
MYRPHRKEWLILAVMTILVWINTDVFDRNDQQLYINRAVITFIGGTMLVLRRSFIGCYHSVILLLTLCAYLALAFDVSQGRAILVAGETYRTIIYGLVGCQLMGIFPTIFAAYRDRNSNNFISVANLSRAFK